MRQVPKYLIIGQGRVATHMMHYLSLLGLSYQTWDRGAPMREGDLGDVTHVLVLIPDDAIETFLRTYKMLQQFCCVHFSGALSTSLAYGAHPLMTFSDELYTLPCYQAIPFVIDCNASLSTLLPGLDNPFYPIDPAKKMYYHALCVIGNNFTTLLWQEVFQRFREVIGLPHEILAPIFKQTVSNVLKDEANALTGPMVRGDQATIQKHLDVLSQDDLLSIYQAFLALYEGEKHV